MRNNMPDTTMQVDNFDAQDSMITEVRESVAKLCGDFQGDYWRKLDREQSYPTDFVKALTDAGFLGALIPEEYGGVGLGMVAASVILEEIHHQGCNAAHATLKCIPWEQSFDTVLMNKKRNIYLRLLMEL